MCLPLFLGAKKAKPSSQGARNEFSSQRKMYMPRNRAAILRVVETETSDVVWACLCVPKKRWVDFFGGMINFSSPVEQSLKKKRCVVPRFSPLGPRSSACKSCMLQA